MQNRKLEAERLGWTFTLVETSPGAFEIAAIDSMGRRRVSGQCSEPEIVATLESVAGDALQLDRADAR